MRRKKRTLAAVLSLTMMLSSNMPLAAFAEEAAATSFVSGGTVIAPAPAESGSGHEDGDAADAVGAESTTYYVSSTKGSNENEGTSAEQAFASLLKINEITLRPGDKVLLERGSVFQNEYLHIKGSGNADAPIIIGSYGDTASPLPLIATNGYGVWYQDYNLASLDSTTHVLRGNVSSCILLYDVEYIEISDIAMTNEGNFASDESYSTADRMDRTGVAAVTQNIGTADHIVLRNLEIRNVQGNVYNKHMCNGGIYMVCAQPKDTATGISKYDDVLIEGCTLSNVNRWGIAVGYTCYWDKFRTRELADEVVMEYGSTNVVVRNNYLSDLGGDGITMMYCYQPLVERNVVTAFSRDMNNSIYTHPVSKKNGGKNRGGMLAAGIWPWKCKTPIFQYNECYDAHYSQDSQAWDADSGDGCVYQYNYSSNNAGGCVMFCLQQAVNSVFRYNISQNDLGGILNLSANPNGEIYNNVFYIKENVPVNRMRNGTTNIYNNIFYYAGSAPAPEKVCNWSWIKGTWSNNIYYNFSNIPNDVNAIREDPLFVNGGSAPVGAQDNGLVYDRSVFNGYKLKENSPAIDAGKPVSNAGEKDFFGNKLDKMPDIGAYETGLYTEDSNAAIIRTPYMITGRGAKQTLNVPSLEKNPTTTEEVLANIEIASKANASILKDGEEAEPMLVEDGMILRISAENGVYRDYTIKIKNSYDYVEEYSSAQGNVWFYQYKSKDGTYENMTVQDQWGGWMESYSNGMSNTWATVARDNKSHDGILSGPLYNKNGSNVESAVMAWRAPKSGSVTLSFGGGSVSGGAKLRGQTSGGPSYLKITKNGDSIITPINMTDTGGAFVKLDSQVIQVEQGDYICVECMTEAQASNPGFYVSPVVSYNNIGDEKAPSVPANVRASQVQDTKAVISWDASTDNVGVEGYNVYVEGEFKGTTKRNSYQLTGLTKGNEYTVEVNAFDLANNISEKGSVKFTAEAQELIYTLPEPVSLKGTEGGITLDEEVLDASKSLNAITITAEFVGPASLGSIISFSESNAMGNHFHVYADGETLGYELRGEWGNYSAKANCLEPGAENSMAFVANPKDYTIKLFADGELVNTKQLNASSWKMLKDYAAMDAVTIGQTPRSYVSKYPFIGDILNLNVYSVPLSDQDIKDRSSETVDVPVTVEKEKQSKDYKPKAKDEVIYIGDEVSLDEGNIANLDELPDDILIEDITDLDEIPTDRPGNYRNKGMLKITYSDGYEKILKVTIRVLSEDGVGTPSEATPSEATPSEAKESDAKRYDPLPQKVRIKPGETLEPEEGIKNKDELPSDTEYKDVTPSNVDKTKDYEAIIKVVYPDGSSEAIKVPVTVSKGSRGTGGSWSGKAGRSQSGGSGSKIINTSNDQIYSDPDMSVSSGSVDGSWILVDGASNKWSYHTSKGALAKNGWMYISHPSAKDEYGKFRWFKFNEDGIMEYGWIKSQNGKWYHLHTISDGNLGVLHRGWYYEPMDGKWYYLDQKTGAMREGWILIDNQYYYFTEASSDLQKEDVYWHDDNHSRRPYGSMYQNERTPDNYYVDANGVWKPES